jgi:spermidine synthase
MLTARLYVIVFLSGAAVLALEILGTRLLGPFYGVSLFLWSALITVTLAALSLGYAVGGRWADRGPTFRRLGTLLGGAGLWVLLVPFLKGPVLHATEALGLRTAVLTTAALLFMPPLTLLGMVSPYAIRLKAQSLDRVGRTAGDLYAVSTVASVVSALAMGFFLIPSLGVTRLVYSIGLALLVACLLALAGGAGRTRTQAGIVVLLLLAGSAGLAMIPDEQQSHSTTLLTVRQSPYAELRVLDAREARHLLVDGGLHSIMSLDDGRSWHPYNAAIDVLKYLYDEPGDMLLIGLGGGTLATRWTELGWSVDAVEIDPVVGELAVQYFDLDPSTCSIHYEDGRRYLAQTTETYDLIVIDAFGSSSIPFHLTTVESFGLAASRLSPQGILAMNVITEGWEDSILKSLAATLRQHFDVVLALPTSEPPDALGNVVLVASQRPLEFDEYENLPRPYDLLADEHEHWWALQMNHAWDNRYEPEAAGALVLTDDKNPVDLWSERINLLSRVDFHEYFDNLDTESW